MRRKYYIDNLRWIEILLLIPFHTSMAWNTWESNYIWIRENKVLSSFVIMLCPFYMPLLFVLAGMSMNFALKKRSYSQFILERIKKLFIPLVSGIVTVVAIMTYFSDRFHNGYTGSFIKHYKTYLGTLGDFTGYDGKFTPAHLWFMLFLFISSLLLLIIVMIQRKYKSVLTFEKLKIWQVFLLVIIPIILSPILNFGGKSIGESFAFVALGFYVFSEDSIIDELVKYKTFFLAITFISCCIFTFIFVWLGYHDSYICDILNEISKWFGILGLLGFGKKCLDVSNKFTKFMTERSFLIYIFHFGWIVSLQYYLCKITHNTEVIYITTIFFAGSLTLLTVEVVRRIPLIRFLFGASKKASK